MCKLLKHVSVATALAGWEISALSHASCRGMNAKTWKMCHPLMVGATLLGQELHTQSRPCGKTQQ